MIAYSCNIACTGCISLSDYKRDGVAPYVDVCRWISEWSAVVEPAVVVVFGGEPCLHPQLIDVCQQIRLAWPRSKIRLITNGYLLDNFDAGAWFELGPFEMQISMHRADHRALINKKIHSILKQRDDWRVSQHGGDHHKQVAWTSGVVTVYKSIFKDFVVPYRLDDNHIVPWNSTPEEAYKICGASSTPILYKGKLYKCPPVANIIDMTGQHYAGYQGYEVQDDIAEFVSNVNQAQAVCGQCPTKQQAVVIDHLDIKNVTVKQKISS